MAGLACHAARVRARNRSRIRPKKPAKSGIPGCVPGRYVVLAILATVSLAFGGFWLWRQAMAPLSQAQFRDRLVEDFRAQGLKALPLGGLDVDVILVPDGG